MSVQETHRPENCNADSSQGKIAWSTSGVHHTDEHTYFDSTPCRVARVRVWVKIKKYRNEDPENSCLNSSGPTLPKCPTFNFHPSSFFKYPRDFPKPALDLN
jgi:hypothetical protein